jgi:hypothetical protein
MDRAIPLFYPPRLCSIFIMRPGTLVDIYAL